MLCCPSGRQEQHSSFHSTARQVNCIFFSGVSRPRGWGRPMKHRECVLRLTRRPYFDRLRFSNGRHSLARVRAVAQRKLPFGNHGFCWKTQSTSRLRSGRKSREAGLRRRLPPLVHCHMFLRCRDSRLRCVLRQRHYALKSTTKSSAGILEHKMHSRFCNSAAVRTGLGRRGTKLQRAWTRMIDT
jgi:hypothetical protein